ncbi:hypothetical protein [Pseudomonas nitroreducens]|uniref:hypothetical protein n=1 Tax=Pseudomonas nitroreducens TaxID=46680 RepID=UPI00351D3D0A
MTLQVTVHVGNWQPSASFEELYKQAAREAKSALAAKINPHGMAITGEPGVMRIVLREDK